MSKLIGNILYKIKNIGYIIIDKFQQRFLLKKYDKFNIPIKNGKYWYYKKTIAINKDTKLKIQRCDASGMYHFENYANAGVHYHYIYGKFINVSDEKIKNFQDSTHSHEFYFVLEEVYNFPESFYIPKDSLEEYSKQELKWIKKLQDQCLKDGLRDIGYFTEPLIKSFFMGLNYNIGELKKRNITKLYGINLKKYLKNNNDDNFITFDHNWNILITKKEKNKIKS